MTCFSSAKEFADCLTLAAPWIEVIKAVLQVGVAALVGVLIWIVKKWRKESKDWETEKAGLIDRKDLAERTAKIAEQERDHYKALLDGSDQQNKLLTDLQRRVDSVRRIYQDDSAGMWSRPIGKHLEGYVTRLRDSIPVILFANQKGGVGKTTLSVNLAACFAQGGHGTEPERVLLIDLDYQGSASNLLIAQNQNNLQFVSAVDHLLADNLNPLWNTDAVIKKVDDYLHFVPASYSLEQLERQIEYSWIIGDTLDDIRYRLARAVLSEHVQKNYDRVIIDAPPRFTSGFINGFCTSTHLFVPMIVDFVAAQAIRNFATQFRKLVPLINPSIQWAGIIGCKTSSAHAGFGLPNIAQPAAILSRDSVRQALNTQNDYFMFDTVIKHNAQLARDAENGIPYLQNPAIRPMFDALATEVARRAPTKQRN